MTDLRNRYEEVERAVCEQVPFGITHVPDGVEQRYDAELEHALSTAPPVARSATAGTPIEIKTCQPEKGSVGTAGQWVFNPRQHERLEELDGRYLLAVVDEFDLVRWVVCGPRDLEPFLSWYDAEATQQYDAQAAIRWPVVMGDVVWTSRGRQGRVPVDDGGESA